MGVSSDEEGIFFQRLLPDKVGQSEETIHDCPSLLLHVLSPQDIQIQQPQKRLCVVPGLQQRNPHHLGRQLLPVGLNEVGPLYQVIDCPLVAAVPDLFEERFVVLVSELWPGHHEL